jgi:hypothetical protein
MTVDELWGEARKLLETKAAPSGRLREVLTELVRTSEGRSKIGRELDLVIGIGKGNTIGFRKGSAGGVG